LVVDDETLVKDAAVFGERPAVFGERPATLGELHATLGVVAVWIKKKGYLPVALQVKRF
jgi:hypothetical protein